MDGVLELGAFFLRKVVILRKPLLSPECLFLSISVTIVGISKEDVTREDLLDKLVLGRRSLESQDVGAVDCDMIEPWCASELMVVAEGDEVTRFVDGEICTGERPRSSASRRRFSSTSFSVVLEYSRRMVER